MSKTTSNEIKMKEFERLLNKNKEQVKFKKDKK